MKKLLIICSLAFATVFSANAENKVKNFNQNETRNYKYEVHKNNHKSHEKNLKSQHHNESISHRHGHPRFPDRRSGSHRDGYYDYVTQRVWIPERCHRVWIPARYEYRRQPCGRFVRVLVCKGYYQTRTIPGYYDYQTVKVWRPHRHCGTRSSFSIRWGW